MTASLQSQIEELRRSIETVEAQRGTLGDTVANLALAGLRQQLASLEEQAAAEATPAEERKLVTILFMDMVGSTGRAEKLDPEEWRQLVERFHAGLGSAVTTHGGTIAQYLGDGLPAFFGAREASEADPENAIRAALGAQAAVAGLLPSEKVQVRAGIHTGLVVVGELGEATHKEFTASGDAMNLAARLQSAAPPGGVLISHDTYRYVRGVFDVTPRAPLTVKGKGEPIQTYLVRQAKPRPFRTVSRGVAGVEAQTVGREAETRALRAAYLRAYEGRGTVWAQLVSAPGLGKSRLLADMIDWTDLREETYRILRARAFPDDANQPFALVRRMWFDRFQIAEDAPLEKAEAKWVERFRDLSGQADCEEGAHALGLLVGLPFADSLHIKAMRNDPTQVKGRALVVSRELVDMVRRQLPVVLMLEDLQWTDAASWEYLMEVFLDEAEAAQRNGLFILGSARPEWRPPEVLTALFQKSMPADKESHRWGTQITLEPLTDEAMRSLAMDLFQRAEDVPEQILDLLIERSEGVPYYAEEMVNWFIDHGILDTRSEPWRFLPERLKEQPLPATLQHLLLTRLGSLSQAERAALQRGAIFGRRFWTGGVEALGVPRGAETLAHVQGRGFVEEQPDSAFEGDTEWTFHQSLLREVTYESVLKRERAALHKVAAEWLERQASQTGRLDEFAGLLGDHCERAGELSAAADWYVRAGKRAMAQGAPREAKAFFTQALNLLPPVDRERRWQALLEREAVLSVLSESEEWKSDLAALLDLAHSLNDDNYLAEATLRQAIYGTGVGDSQTIDQAAREALAAAKRCGNETIEAKALAVLTVADLIADRKADARNNMEQALFLARNQDDESVLAFVVYRAAYCSLELGDLARSDALQAEQIELDHRLGNRAQEAIGLGNQGAWYLGMGFYKQARLLIEQSLAISASLGARRAMAYGRLNLAEVFRSTGDLRRAYQLAEEGLAEATLTRGTRARVFALHEVGLLLLPMGDPAGAARRWEEAHELAVGQGLAAAAAECVSGLAACALMQGRVDEAGKHAHQAWDYWREHGWYSGTNPAISAVSCAEAFDAAGERENARALLENAQQALMQVADTLNTPAWRASLLENVPENRALLEMWERLKA